MLLCCILIILSACLFIAIRDVQESAIYLSSLNCLTFQKICKYQVMYAKLNDYYYVTNNIFIVYFLVPKYS